MLNTLVQTAQAVSIPNLTTTQDLGNFVSTIYDFSIAVVGIVIFIRFIYAGWLYLTAAGNAGKTDNAKSIMKNAVLGTVLLFSSWLILYVINPDLVANTFDFGILKSQDYRNKNPGSTYLTRIESFDVSPKMASFQDNTELLFSLKVGASILSLDTACGGAVTNGSSADRDVRYQVYVTGADKTTEPRLIREESGKWHASDFGTGKIVSMDFKQKLKDGVDVDMEGQNSKIINYQAVFSCYNGQPGWAEILRSSPVNINLTKTGSIFETPPITLESGTVIYNFSVNPKTVKKSENPEMSFSADIFSSNSNQGVMLWCKNPVAAGMPADDCKVKTELIGVEMVSGVGETTSLAVNEFKCSEFSATGSGVPFNISQNLLNKMQVKTDTVNYTLKLSCYDVIRGWMPMAQSITIPVSVQP